MKTPLCELLGIDWPVLQAPMAGGWTTPELVAAVAEAGGFGQLAAARLSPGALVAQIRRTRELTTRPFGVNFIIAPPDPPAAPSPAHQQALSAVRAELGLPDPPPSAQPPPAGPSELLEAALAEGVNWVSFALGDPAPFADRLRAAGVRWMTMVTTVAEAQAAEQGGAAALVAQGAEAGGHRSTFVTGADRELPLIGTLALVPQVVDAVRVPVIAAGGIMDGRGLAAALMLGAGAAQLGTRFLLAAEAGVFAAYRERLLAAVETDTVLTRAVSGRPARGLRNRLIETFDSDEVTPLPWPHQGAAVGDIVQHALAQGAADWVPLLAGQGLRLATRIEPAAGIVAGVVEQARRLLNAER